MGEEMLYMIMDETDAPYEEWELPYKRTLKDELATLRWMYSCNLIPDSYSDWRQLKNHKGKPICQTCRGKEMLMSHYIVGLRTKDGQPFPEEIYRKAKDLCYLFQESVYWQLLPNEIYFVFWGSYYDIADGLEQELTEKHVTRNMVDFYKWACEYCEAYAECWNPCDYKYGPHSMEELVEAVNQAGKHVKDWEEPVGSTRALDRKVLFLRLDYETQKMCIQLDEFAFEIEVPEEITFIEGADIQNCVIQYQYGKYEQKVVDISLSERPQVLVLEEEERQRFTKTLMELKQCNLLIDHYRDARNPLYRGKR